MRGLLTLFACAGALFCAASAHAQTYANITIGWTPSSSPDVAGYEIYYGTNSGNYQSAVPVSATATNVTINGLVSGMTYYFAATSYTTDNGQIIQSAFSPEISGVVGSTTLIPATLTLTSTSSGGNFGFNVSGSSGAQYIVQASTDLIHWVTIQTDSAPFNFVDSNASQFSRRFYRTASASSN